MVLTSDSEKDGEIVPDIIKIEKTIVSPQRKICLDSKLIHQFFDERFNEANELLAGST